MNSPAFQTYPGDELKQVFKLSNEQRGIYWTLKLGCWEAVTLPNDERKLAQMAGTTPARLRTLWPGIRPLFELTDDGQLTHPGLDEQRKKQAARSEASRVANEARWGDPRPPDYVSDQVSDCDPIKHPKAIRKRSFSSSSSPSKQKENPPSPLAAADAAERDDGFREFWEAYPRKTGKLAARKAWRKALNAQSKGVILQALTDQVGAGQFSPEDRYRPHPATWLNQGRWEDAITSHNGHSSHASVGAPDTWKPAPEKPWLPFVVPFRGGRDDFYRYVKQATSPGNYDTWVEPSERYGQEEITAEGLRIWVPNDYFVGWFEQRISALLEQKPAALATPVPTLASEK